MTAAAIPILPLDAIAPTEPLALSPVLQNGDEASYAEFFLQSFDQDLVAIPEYEDTIDSTGLTSVDISSIDALLDEKCGKNGIHLQIHEDGGLNAGCGGKLWLAGKLLSLYLIRHYDEVVASANGLKRIVELGSGTGVVGLALAAYLQNGDAGAAASPEIFLTDLPIVLPVIAQNIVLNNAEALCRCLELDWFADVAPAELVATGEKIDLILVADCVYDERLFAILVKTLVLLCTLNHKPGDTQTQILFTWKKRRRSNLRFFKMAKKAFNVVEVTGYQGYEEFQKQRCHLFKLTLK